MFYRFTANQLIDSLADSPVVIVTGARQAGKSTLVRNLADSEQARRYVTLDDATILAAAQDDATGFLAGLEKPVTLDEVQRAPNLFLPLKAEVDRDRTPGRFLLTGSANVLLLPQLSESLAGRMEILTLRTLSQGEIEGARERFVDAMFADASLPRLSGAAEDRSTLFARMLRGGYPEAVARSTEARRRAWFASYVTTILQRDVRDLANIEGLTALPRLLSLIAARASGLLNFAEVSRSSTIPQSTLKRYMALLEMTFLVEPLPSWAGSLSRRLVKAPKLFLCDTGLLSHLQGLTEERLAADTNLAGALAENFVVGELRKQAAWSDTQPELFHFRAQTGQEVDVVMEDRSGKIVGVEVKASASVGANDFKGLRDLAATVAGKFRRGVVLYTGSESVPFGENFHALPISALWRLSA